MREEEAIWNTREEIMLYFTLSGGKKNARHLKEEKAK